MKERALGRPLPLRRARDHKFTIAEEVALVGRLLKLRERGIVGPIRDANRYYRFGVMPAGAARQEWWKAVDEQTYSLDRLQVVIEELERAHAAPETVAEERKAA